MRSPGVFPGVHAPEEEPLPSLSAILSTNKVLEPAEELLMVQELAVVRKRIQRLLSPVLQLAPAGTRLTHFDQQLSFAGNHPGLKKDRRERVRRELKRYRKLKHRLVLANLAWVTKLARAQRTRSISAEDLFQEGVCGLLKAIDRFEAERGLRLMTYATWYIREAMQQVRARQSHTVSLSAHDQTLLGEIETQRVDFQHQFERQPTASELAAAVHRKADFLRQLHAATTPTMSLDQNVAEHTIPVCIADPAERIDHEEAVDAALRKMLSALPERERLVVTRRFGLAGEPPASLEVLGNILQVSKERIRQLQRQAIRRMHDVAQRRHLDRATVL